MPIELLQVVTPDDDAVDLWIDVDAAMALGLAQGETNPTCLAELAGVGVPAVSQHLAKLRLAGICRPRRDGQRVWYELVDARVRDLVVELLAPVGARRKRKVR